MKWLALSGRVAWLLIVGGMLLPCSRLARAEDLDSLRQCFEQDPAAGFELAGKLFRKPMQKGDLDGMMEIFRVVAPQAKRCYSVGLLEDMADASVPIALRSARWETVGELFLELSRAWGNVDSVAFLNWPGSNYERSHYFAIRARQAYERTGNVPEALQDVKDEPWPFPAFDKWLNRNLDGLKKSLPRYAEAVLAMGEAQALGRDAEALAMAEQLLRQVAQEKDLNQIDGVLGHVSKVVRLRGGARLISVLCSVWPRERAAIGGFNVSTLANACIAGWSGRNDVYRDGYYWVCNQLDARGALRDSIPCTFVTKLDRFGRKAEAREVLQRIVEYCRQCPVERCGAHGLYPNPEVLLPYTPYNLKAALVNEWCRVTVGLAPLMLNNENYHGETALHSLPQAFNNLVRFAPPGEEKAWAVELGGQLLNAATQIPSAGERAWGAMEAGKLFERGGRKDLSARAQSISVSLAQGDPKSLLRCALTAAQALASEGQWQKVENWLQPVVNQNGQEVNHYLVDATLLLEQAKRRLGKNSEADACLAKFKSLIGQGGITPNERVNYLMNLTSRTKDTAQKTVLLEQARQEAGKAGLGMMQQAITDQLTQLALSSNDLEAQKKALLNIVKEQETKRDRLAFDPLLRQQWFAQNLSTYRRLLQVAARLDDASLALWCAERMRARALMDQLAWRKVDLSVRLPAAVRKQFEDLRKKRHDTYALLRQVSGIQSGDDPSMESSDDSRGLYMPVRGSYMPIRGGLDPAQPVSEEDVDRLKQMLEDLAKEEAALESVIREAVPAYRFAVQAVTPDQAELLRAVPDNVGVLEYTLIDDDIVAVAIGPGKHAVAKMLYVTPGQLTSGVEELRKLIVTRSNQFDETAQSWYQSLVEPFEDVLQGSSQVVIVADGLLQLLPFSALKDSEGRYLIDRYPISFAPSLTLVLSSRGATPRAEKSALIVAAPKLSNSAQEVAAKDGRGMYIPIRGAYIPVRGAYVPIRGESGLSGQLTAMAAFPLPGAKAEGEMVATRFTGAILLTGSEATKERLEREASKCNLIHLATHGYADPEVPEFSGLLFAGTGDKQYEALTAQEVYLWQLRAQLVTLSACETGVGKDVEGEGLLGLTRAFLYAGARDVVCSLWQVADESTAQLMEKFYDEWQKSADTARALQTAQRALLRKERTKHPFYWAAFVVVQGPR